MSNGAAARWSRGRRVAVCLLIGAVSQARAAAPALAAQAGLAPEPFTDVRLLDGVCYGVIVGLMTYAMLMYLTFRDRMYVYFLLASFWSLWTLAILNGHCSSWMSGAGQGLAERLAGAVLALWAGFALLFGWKFLYLRRDSPRIGRIALALAAISALAALGALAGALGQAATVTVAVSAAGLVLLPLGAHPSPRHGYKFRAWYLLATLTILACLLLIAGTRWSLLPPEFVTRRYIQWGIVAQAIIYSAALGMRLPRLWSQQGELHTRAAELSRAAQTDPLTAIANRAGLASHALAMLGPAERCALLIIDLDHFKPINDQFGHGVGDQVLMRVARRLQRAVGDSDVVARLGGDEFALLLASHHARADLAVFADTIIKSISKPITVREQLHRVSASMGIAIYPDDGKDLSRLLRRADKALYRVKRRGRDGYAFFDELPPSASSLGRF